MVSLNITFVIITLAWLILFLEPCATVCEQLSVKVTGSKVLSLMFLTSWLPFATLNYILRPEQKAVHGYHGHSFLDVFAGAATVNLNRCVIFLHTLGRCWCKFIEFQWRFCPEIATKQWLYLDRKRCEPGGGERSWVCGKCPQMQHHKDSGRQRTRCVLWDRGHWPELIFGIIANSATSFFSYIMISRC